MLLEENIHNENIEKCLARIDNRFDLVACAAVRMRLLNNGHHPKTSIDNNRHKNSTIALAEIADNLVGIEVLKKIT